MHSLTGASQVERSSSSSPLSEEVPVEAPTPRPKIVLVAVDAALRARIRGLLEEQDYVVDALESVDAALAALTVAAPDLVVYAPTHDADGEILRLQNATGAGLLVLAAVPGDSGVIRALDAGADDAVPPPYARAELFARLRSTLRRSKRSARVERRFADLTLDLEARELHVDGRPIALTRLELRLLEELMVASGMAVKHDEFRPTARILIEPWLVEAALQRLGDRRLTPAEQITVWNATRTPKKVNWPEWWTHR